MHASTKLSTRHFVRAMGATAAIAAAFLFAGVAMAHPADGGKTATSTSGTNTTTAVVKSATPTTTSSATAPSSTSTQSTSTVKPSTTTTTPTTTTTHQASTQPSGTATSGTSNSTAVSATAPQQSGSQTAATGANGAATNVNVGGCGCTSGNQSASNNVSNTTTQTIVQIAPSTAIATATNYGPGSASATAVAAPTQIASQSAITRADDPASNVGSGHQTANNTTSNTTTQTINQYAPTTATADATSYNGHAVATAIAAPTQIASQSATTRVFGDGDNVGLGGVSCGFLCGFSHQTVTNTATNTTTQSIHQNAPTTAEADATSGGSLCGFCNFGGNSGNATAIAIAKPVQIASQSANDTVSGKATNFSLGSGHQTADNTTTNTTDQSIDQRTNSTATATATNDPFGFHNSQSATAVAVSQPSQLAVQGALNVVTGSANNSALGFGCDCVFFGGSHQRATNETTNTTDQDITQHGNADATATANNDAFGFGNHQTATAIAVAAPKQSASEYSAAFVSGIATNIGLGHGSDQFAFNVTTNDVPQTITQNANSDATADAENDAFGFNKSQNAQATAIAAPSQTAGITATDVVKGQAINTDLGSSSCSLCDLFGGHTHQTATNETTNDVPQTITQRAPVTADAYAFNNGLGFDLGLCEICDFGHFGNFGNNSGSIQNATAVAAAAPVQRAGEALAINASGVAANVNLGNGSVHQHATNDTYSDPTQSITQRAPSDVFADAENNPESAPTLTSECGLFCGHFGSNSVRAQNATAIATAQPIQTASEALSQSLSGSAINIASGNSNSCSLCGCDFLCDSHGRVHQDADNYVESGPEQTITQRAPTSVDAYAYNWPSGDSISILPEVACFSSCGHNFGHSFGGTQSATAIAAAQPVQSASESYWASVSGQALNTLVRTGNSCSLCDLFGGSAHQDADNSVENFPYQTITQRAPVTADADAENWAFGHGSQQQALAIAVGAPRQLASQFERDFVLGTASNVSLGSGSVHQDADNHTDNGACNLEICGGYQTITQRAPVTADADAYNYPISSVPWFFGFGNGGLQSATAIAAGAPVQAASQIQDRNYVSGVASNVDLGGQCGFCGFLGHGTDQDATNYTDNEVTQIITQRAPTTVTADAENEGQTSGWWCILFGCSNNPQTATAIATSAAKQTASEKASAWLTGEATNVNLSNSFGGCHLFCGFGHEQDADNTSLNTLDQFLTQRARSDSEATAFNTPSWFDLGGIWGQGGDWNGCGACGGLGLNTLSPLAGLTSNLGFGVPSFNAPLFSTPVTLSGLSNGLGNLGSTNIAFGGQDLGIKLGLSIGNSESLNLPTISNLLHGVSLFGLLQGAVSLSLNLSVTTPWVQYAAAVAHQTPYSVLFSVTQQQGIAPWLGILL